MTKREKKIQIADQYSDEEDLKLTENLENDRYADEMRKLDTMINKKGISAQEKRLLQNRKSATKCRMKRLVKMEKLQKQRDKILAENNMLEERNNSLAMLLESKDKEKSNLQRQIEGQQTFGFLLEQLANYLPTLMQNSDQNLKSSSQNFVQTQRVNHVPHRVIVPLFRRPIPVEEAQLLFKQPVDKAITQFT